MFHKDKLSSSSLRKNRDKRYIKNWRPVSLLNVVNKTISSKLKTVSPTLISSQQTAYVKKRFIGGSDRLISDIIEISGCFSITGFLVTMDIEKAFDSLDHSFLISVLKKFGFGKNFITWIEILLKDQQSCFINGGTTTQYFNLERGAPQSDPVSAYLFILVLEVLFIFIRKHPEIKGIEKYVNTASFILHMQTIRHFFERCTIHWKPNWNI